MRSKRLSLVHVASQLVPPIVATHVGGACYSGLCIALNNIPPDHAADSLLVTRSWEGLNLPYICSH
jgi:hypothetical protein